MPVSPMRWHPPASVITIESALKDWLRRQQITCARSTIRDYTSAVYHHLIPRFGSQVLSELNPGEIRDWTATLKISPKRINNILIPLRGITSEAFYNETIERDPLQRVRNLVLEHRDPHPFTRMEVSAILKVLDGQSRNVIQFAFATGLRTSELIALRWGDVDLADRKVHIRRAIVRNVEKEPKTSSGRRSIELDDSALASLQQQIDFTFGTSEWVFHDPCNDTRWRDDSAIRKRVWIPALKRAGIRYRNPYQTRHTFASTHLSDGKNPMWVAYQLGHRDWGMIRKVYGRWLAS